MLFGYAITAVTGISFIGLLVSMYLCRRDLKNVLSRFINRYSLLAIALVVAFFIVFMLLFVHPAEQLYFDENIYQGIAINILQSGNALWCQAGSGYLTQCLSNAVYHDPVSWAFFVAIAFGLFGIGTATAFNTELLVGVLAIIGVFLLAGALTERKEHAVIASVIIALMPEVMIWARTQMDIDLPFMMLATFAFFFFVVGTKRPNNKTLALALFSLVLAAYVRIEAILLIPIFIVLYFVFGDDGVKKTLKKRFSAAVKSINAGTLQLSLVLMFVLLMLPQLYYISSQYSSPDYGQPAGQGVISFANFMSNYQINAQFILGAYNAISYFPAVFPPLVTVLAVAGVIIFLVESKNPNKYGIVLLLAAWFAAYMLFYDAFYAGSALYGVDVRFMLQLVPSLCILAAFAISEVGYLVASIGTRRRRARLYSYGACAALVAVLIVYPFTTLLPNVTLPPTQMPQQSLIYPATQFIWNNYTAVPTSCEVFTFTPDVWYELNRSAAQIGLIDTSNATLKQSFLSHPCIVFDYGYWCTVPPYQSTTCSNVLSSYKTKILATSRTIPGSSNVTFYQLLNYS